MKYRILGIAMVIAGVVMVTMIFGAKIGMAKAFSALALGVVIVGLIWGGLWFIIEKE